MDVETKTIFQDEIDACEQTCLKTAVCNAYSQQKEQVAEDDLVTQFLPMVHKIARRSVTYLKPPLSYEDLISAGVVGLLKAARDYDPSHQAEFPTYAYIRIRGAILDELKAHSFMPANVAKQIRQAAKLRMEIMEQRGAAPTDDELAQKLQITVDKLYQLFNANRAKHFLSFGQFEDDQGTDFYVSDDSPRPSEHLEREELIERLTEAIGELEERQRQIIVLYYQQELTMKQIAEVFGLTEPRVSQLHAKAIFSLSLKLKEWKYDRE
jgi:RNA polymerase sigma factor for flagellar operon FliA